MKKYIIKKEYRKMFKNLFIEYYNKSITMDENGILFTTLKKNGKSFPTDQRKDIEFLIKQNIAEEKYDLY